jgi:MFS family permease
MLKKNMVWAFALISGVFQMSSNAVSIIIPLRMADQSLSTSSIGGALSALPLGVVIFKLFIGRHSDVVGQKRYLIISFFGGIVVNILFVFSHTVVLYCVLLVFMGFIRGMFTSVNTSYMIEITEEASRGKGIGNILSVASFLTSIGGIIAGIMYGYHEGNFAFILIATLLTAGLFFILFAIPEVEKQREKFISRELFTGMDKKIYWFCLIMFMQTFVTSPMWNTLVPLHFYVRYGLSAMFVGILMSMDEFIGSPIFLISGRIVDKYPIRNLTCAAYLLASLVSVSMIYAKSQYIFLLGFLLSGVFVTATFVAVPKAESYFLRENAKGFELALISMAAAIGDALGNIFMSRLVDKYGIGIDVLTFAVIYLILAVVSMRILNSSRIINNAKGSDAYVK